MEEDNKNDSFLVIEWQWKDILEKIKLANLELSEDKIETIFDQIYNQLLENCTARGWETIDTILANFSRF